MVYNSWTELSMDCPVDISRITRYSREFKSNIPKYISNRDLEKVKEELLKARKDLDAMINSLIQMLYDPKIIVNDEDKISLGWIVDNLAALLRKLDEDQATLLTNAESMRAGVGVAKLSAYAKLLETIADSLIYDSLLKSKLEYKKYSHQDASDFLHILFRVMYITLATMGIVREGYTKTLNKKTTAMTFPPSFSGLNIPSPYSTTPQQKEEIETEKEIAELPNLGEFEFDEEELGHD